ncbi:MAG: YggS family pyridoxal phosphate-dependent enzyme [Gammaproteobacteria bacterium]
MLTGPQFPPSIPEGAAQAQAAVTAATLAAGREPGAVTLVAVSKLQPATAVVTAHQAGLRHFGENYVKEGVAKVQALAHLPLVWHFIGALQANKTRAVAEHFDWVHTVDRFRLAERLAAQRPPNRPPLQVCLQVMLEPEPGKAGLAPPEVPELAIAIAALPGLQLRGLMCIPPPETDPVRQRRHFRALAALLRELQSCGLPLDTLSMGMSSDFAAAILEGATHVRLGTAIFGSRPSPVPRNSA